jgi:CheY-like chemotaxis protein
MKEHQSPTILLIEDNLSIIESLTLLLSEEGYQVEAWDRKSAIHLQEPYPDLILLDLLLGGIDGKTICQQLKSQPATYHLPIILMSANKLTPQIAQEVHADAWILKPFDLSILLDLLETHLARNNFV